MHHRSADYLVAGSGIAGLYFALKASESGSVIIVTKDNLSSGATIYAQGGVAASLASHDTPEKHKLDTLTAGAGLCDESAVDLLVHEGVDRINELIGMGMPFTRTAKGELDLGKEGGHSENRIIHAKDQTGKNLHSFLLDEIRKKNNIELLENHIAIDLITNHHLKDSSIDPKCYGIYVYSSVKNQVETIISKYTCLATGGAGRIYPITTNPKECTGDGIAMGYRAGCRVRNMEFIQFHPTALYRRTDPVFLLTEALRGKGALLRRSDGTLFMEKYSPLKELAPRDIVARGIDSEIKETGDSHVYLDCTVIGEQALKQGFPHIYNTLKEKFKIDPAKEPVPVAPAAHYTCGGILTDLDGKTDIPNLFAFGETASTGVHGANRLASNSLLESLVFAHRAISYIKKMGNKDQPLPPETIEIPPWNQAEVEDIKIKGIIKHQRTQIQKIMWEYIGLVRNTRRLEKALKIIDLVYEDVLDFYKRSPLSREIIELRNIALNAQIVIRSAIQRKESRGLHFMTDYPEKRDVSRKDTVIFSHSFKQIEW